MKLSVCLILGFLAIFSACSGDDGDDSSTQSVGGATSTLSGSGGGYVLATGGTSASPASTSISSSTAGASAFGGSVAVGGTSSALSSNQTGGASSVSTGGTESGTGGSLSTVGGSTSSSSIPTDIVPATGDAQCVPKGLDMCPVKFVFVDGEMKDMTVTFFLGCGKDKDNAGNDWAEVCANAECSPSGGCECDTSLPKGYWILTNVQLNKSTSWAVGEGNGVFLNGATYANGYLFNKNDALLNALGYGYNFVLKIDC